MSIAKVKEEAAAQKGDNVSLHAAVLAEALKEAGEKPDVRGSLAEHVKQTLAMKPDAVMTVHREAHLGKLLGVKPVAAVTSPSGSKLET